MSLILGRIAYYLLTPNTEYQFDDAQLWLN
jgi:hypothetical protein